MKCPNAEQAILLADSGEVGTWSRLRLQRHLVDCPSCRAFQADLHATRAALQALPVPALSAAARRAILDAATPDRRDVMVLAPTLRPVTWWRPALAAALVIALLVAGLMLRRDTGAPTLAASPADPVEIRTVDEAVDAELDALQKLLLASLDDSTESATDLNEDELASALLALQENGP